MGEIVSREDDGDSRTNWWYWGTTYGTTPENSYRDTGDGEKTTGLIDYNGRYSNGEMVYLMTPEMTTVNTGCYLVDRAPGIKNPGVKICPLTTKMGLFDIQAFNYNVDPVGGIQLEIVTLGGEEIPQVLSSQQTDMKGK